MLWTDIIRYTYNFTHIVQKLIPTRLIFGSKDVVTLFMLYNDDISLGLLFGHVESFKIRPNVRA